MMPTTLKMVIAVAFSVVAGFLAAVAFIKTDRERLKRNLANTAGREQQLAEELRQAQAAVSQGEHELHRLRTAMEVARRSAAKAPQPVQPTTAQRDPAAEMLRLCDDIARFVSLAALKKYSTFDAELLTRIDDAEARLCRELPDVVQNGLAFRSIREAAINCTFMSNAITRHVAENGPALVEAIPDQLESGIATREQERALKEFDGIHKYHSKILNLVTSARAALGG